MRTFDIQLFGAVEIYREGRPLTGFRSQKTLVLLAYLISRNRPLTRDHLAGLFWPEATQQQALGHLRRALYNLSKNLPGCLDVNRRTAAFHPQSPAVVDIRRFEMLVKQGDAASLAEAADLIRAPFLEGIYFSGCPELETWLAAEQERWRQQAIIVLEAAAHAAGRQGDYDRALTYTQRLVNLAPLREKYCRQLMQLYTKTGQRQTALAHYQSCRRLLAEELDISPSPETDALYQRIRRITAVHHNLPPSPTPFIGRQAELDALRPRLANPDCRLITIGGAGGIGKTRLALELARQSVNHFLEGVWFVELAGVFTTEGLLTALGTVFNLSATPGGNRAAQLVDYLRDKELLLVLDNFEQLADTPDLLADILQEATAVQLIVTSRRPLNLQEEWLFDLDGLPWPQPGETGNLLAYEAPRLFAETARRRSPRFDLAANSAAVIRICQLVQGSPLALEMAAAACRDMPCAAVAAAISENLDILQTPLRNIPERQRSVQAVFDYSWDLLDDTEQAAYARLSLFHGSFSLAAARSVADVTEESIRRLAKQYLLKQTGRHSRYEIHELQRRYARGKLERDPAQANQIAFRHAAWFLARLAEYETKFDKETRAAVTADWRNIAAAWRWSAAHGQWRLLAQAGASLTDYFLDTGAPREGIGHLDAAIAQLETASSTPARQPTPPPSLRGRLLAHKARLLARSGQSDAARQTARQALSAAAPDARTQVEAGYALASADYEQGNYQASKEAAQTALHLAQASDLPRLAIVCLNHLGRCCRECGELDASQNYFEQTAELARALPFPQYEISACINRSLTQLDRGNYAAAEEFLRQALALAGRLQISALTGNIYLNLGTACFHQGKYAEGQTYYQAAQEAYQRSGNRLKQGLGCHAQASVALEMGDFAAARRSFEQALALYRETGAKHNQFVILNELSGILRLTGDYPAAGKCHREALALSQAIGENINRLSLRVNGVQLALDMGDLAWAEAELAQIDKLLPQDRPVEQKGLAYLAWARYWQFRGDLTEAARYGKMALALFRGQNRRALPACAARQGQIMAEMAAWEPAQKLFATALQLWEGANQPHLAAEARAGLARVALAEGNLAAALEQVEAILHFLDGAAPPNTLAGTQEPALVYLTCYEVLQAAGDGRATAVLEEGLDFLRQRAARLDETGRRSFRENVPANRKLAAAG